MLQDELARSSDISDSSGDPPPSGPPPAIASSASPPRSLRDGSERLCSSTVQQLRADSSSSNRPRRLRWLFAPSPVPEYERADSSTSRTPPSRACRQPGSTSTTQPATGVRPTVAVCWVPSRRSLRFVHPHATRGVALPPIETAALVIAGIYLTAFLCHPGCMLRFKRRERKVQPCAACI